MIFDDKRKRRKEEEEFEKIIKEMEKLIEEAFKSAFNMQPFVRGFSLKVDEKGRAEIEEFGEDEGIDIVEDDKKIYITLETPDIKEREIKIKVNNDFLEIRGKNYYKEIKLPCKVNPRKIKKSFKNRILDIELQKL